MNAKSKSTGSDLTRVDAHRVQSAEYEELPELTDGFFEAADQFNGAQLVRRGRPKSENRKVLLSVRYSPEVVDYFRGTGEGWQSRMDEVLRDWIKTHPRT